MYDKSLPILVYLQYFHSDLVNTHGTFHCKQGTVLTGNYAPFVYKPPLLFASEVYLSPISAPIGLYDSDKREEG